MGLFWGSVGTRLLFQRSLGQKDHWRRNPTRLDDLGHRLGQSRCQRAFRPFRHTALPKHFTAVENDGNRSQPRCDCPRPDRERSYAVALCFSSANRPPHAAYAVVVGLTTPLSADVA